ncbi:MAG: kelch repeat-containing protein [Bacteroidia bacterium]|nr:kelch repeat-containing protein [Bacteroidia bacterium]
MKTLTSLLFSLCCCLFLQAQWTNLSPTNDGSHSWHFQKHECGVVIVGDTILLVGGRGSKRALIYNPQTNHVSTGSDGPIEFHHFQAVEKDGIAYLGMGMTGGYPNETPIANLYTYDVRNDSWNLESAIPPARVRGSAQAILIGDWIYYFNGLTVGHQSGHVNMTDRYNVVTKQWEVLANSPRARDHSIALYYNNKVYLVGGRRSKVNHGGLHSDMVSEIDVYDIPSDSWTTLGTLIPTDRAAPMAAFLINTAGNVQLNVWGGEYAGGTYALGEGLDLVSESWETIDPLTGTTHASQIVRVSVDTLYLIGGAINGGNNRPITDPAYVQRFVSDVIFGITFPEETDKIDPKRPFLYQVDEKLYVNLNARKMSLIGLDGKSLHYPPASVFEIPDELSAGIYLFKVITDKGKVATQKIMVK